MQTVAEVREIVSPYVGPSGACAEDQVVLDSINQVRSILYELGDWEGTTELACVVPYCGTVTLPPVYSHIIKAFSACRLVRVVNDWFTPIQDSGSCGRETVLIKQEGSYVTFQDWPCIPASDHCCDQKGFRLKVIFEDDIDEGVSLDFFGRGVNLHDVKITKTCVEAWVPCPTTNNEHSLLSLTRVTKPKTSGRIRVYGFDGFLSNPTNERLLALYEPKWINPEFSRYTVSRGVKQVIAKAKKRYIPFDSDDQPFDLHVEAIIHGLQAITERRSRNLAGYNANMKMAIDFLQAQLGRKVVTSSSPIQMSQAYKVEGLIP